MICDTKCNNLVTRRLYLLLVLHLAGPATAEFMREVAAPDLDLAQATFLPHSSAWSRPGPPYREINEQYSQDINKDLDREKRKIGRSTSFSSSGIDKRPETLQQKLTKNSRKLENHVFLPGFGSFAPSTVHFEKFERPERQIVEEPFSLDLDDDLLDILIRDTIEIEEHKKSNNDAEKLSPVLVTLSDTEPLAALKKQDNSENRNSHGAGSCEYQQVSEEQMALAADTGDCRKGGMRCERKCEARAGGEECREVLVDVCEDQPEEACDTVMEKHCRTVQEETCEDEPSKTQTVCNVEMNEVCKMVADEVCTEESKMECAQVNREICTTIKEEVCRPDTVEECQEIEKVECSLVPDAVCRNVTETRFDEKCWTEEESVCRTVYDTVLEHKCEMVNITVPQRECEQLDNMEPAEECRVEAKEVTRPVCLTLMDKVVEEKCEDYFPEAECYQESCQNVTRPLATKECHQVMEEVCQVVVEQVMEEQCVQVESLEYGEKCEDREAEECTETSEWVCEDQDLGLGAGEYGAPEVDEDLDTYNAPQAPPRNQHWRRKKSYDGSKQRAKSFVKKRLSRSDENDTDGGNTRERRDSEANFDTFESASEKVGAAFLSINGQKFNADYYGRIPGGHEQDYISTTPATFFHEAQAKALESTYKPKHKPLTTLKPVKKCYTTPKRDCKTVIKRECKQVPRPVSKEVCVPVKSSRPRQECIMRPRQECEVREGTESVRQCGVVAAPRRPEQRCSTQVREVPREMCNDIKVMESREVCDQKMRSVPSISCETRMKEIELKEICVDIELQLPREECRTEERQECRHQPRREVVQRCEPSVREACHTRTETECSQKCSEKCEQRDKKMCMTIPQEECQEVTVPVCQDVTRRQCDLVPEETCQEVEQEAGQEARCRTNTRLECEQRPREQCGTTFRSVCSKKPSTHCSDRIEQDCSMACSPVFWCKVCSEDKTSQTNLFY